MTPWCKNPDAYVLEKVMGLWPVPYGVKPVYLWSKSNKFMFIVVGNSETLKMVNLLKIPRNPGPVDEKAAKDEKTVIVWWKG